MTEDVELIIEETRTGCKKALEHLEHELARLRAGRATPAPCSRGLLQNTTESLLPSPRLQILIPPTLKTIMIQPWEKTIAMGTIEKAILAANLGVTPVNNGEV
ncbi:MAG: hypothetical protein MZV63_34220 [Marinilabiliales bacterium]|nr:hypothetical protein [Marinilabiliales bacterium]